MTLLLRIILIVVSVLAFSLVINKIRHSKMRIEDAVFWVLMLLMMVIFAIFPAVADFLAHLLGIYSTANFLFLFIIFLLIMKVFAMSVRISELETRYKELVQEDALEKTLERIPEDRPAGAAAQAAEKTAGAAAQAAEKTAGAAAQAAGKTAGAAAGEKKGERQ